MQKQIKGPGRGHGPSRRIHSFIAEFNQEVSARMGDPREKTPDHPQSELVTQVVLEPTAGDDERFRALKLAVLTTRSQKEPHDTLMPPSGAWSLYPESARVMCN